MFNIKCMIYNIIWYDYTLFSFKIRVSRIFQETAWRAKNCCQATHMFLCDFLGSSEEPPGGKKRAARRHISDQPSFWVFSMNFLAVINTHQATRVKSNWLNFDVLCVLSRLWMRRKGALTLNWLLDARNKEIMLSIGVNLMKFLWTLF